MIVNVFCKRKISYRCIASTPFHFHQNQLKSHQCLLPIPSPVSNLTMQLVPLYSKHHRHHYQNFEIVFEAPSLCPSFPSVLQWKRLVPQTLFYHHL